MRLLLSIIFVLSLQVLLPGCVAKIEDLDFICDDEDDCKSDEKCVYVSNLFLCKPDYWCEEDYHCPDDQHCNQEEEECEF